MNIILIVTISVLVQSAVSQLECESGAMCNDNNDCTGLPTSPDSCEDGICIPGESYCPICTRQTLQGQSEITGELQVINDEKWFYFIWSSTNSFIPAKVYLYSASTPLVIDDIKTFPFRIEFTEQVKTIQMRVRLDLLKNPTEVDPVYFALNLHNLEGSQSWMKGMLKPSHKSQGGSFSFTTVCHCSGYSHVNEVIDWTSEIYSFSSLDAQTPPDECNIASQLIISSLLLILTLFLSF